MISILEAGILQRLEKKERNQSVSPNVKLSTCVFSGGTTVCQLDLPSVGVGVGVGAGGPLCSFTGQFQARGRKCARQLSWAQHHFLQVTYQDT